MPSTILMPECLRLHCRAFRGGTAENCVTAVSNPVADHRLQKGDVPAAPSGTATLLRLSPNYRFYPRPDVTPDFRYPRLSWLDGRCVQGPGTYSPRHG